MKINKIITREGFMRIEWESTGDPGDIAGWGQVDIFIRDNKFFSIDSETLGREFVMKLLKQAVDSAKMD
jgi:hypothetical protein